MAEASIPVDLFNPGQVFACLGFMEAAEILLSNVEGGFDWSKGSGASFFLCAAGKLNPFEIVLEFLAEADLKCWGPVGYVDPPPQKGGGDDEDVESDDGVDEMAAAGGASSLGLSIFFPAKAGDRMALPIRLVGKNGPVADLGHWADGSSRENFKLYAGNRSADAIARAMLMGVRSKPTKKQKTNQQLGDLKTKGLRQLWEDDRTTLIKTPFDVLTPMGGSFNFDPRGAWTAIDAGYSPNEHNHAMEASPVVEFLAAWGLEHARPVEFALRQVRYTAWGVALPPMLARAALAGALPAIPSRQFHFELNLSGKNKVVTFAQEEPHDIAHG